MEKPKGPVAFQGKKGPAGIRRGDSWTLISRPAMTRAGHFTAVLESRPDWTQQQPHSVPCLLTRREGILKGGAAHPEGVGFNHQRSKPRPAGLPFPQGTAAASNRLLPCLLPMCSRLGSHLFQGLVGQWGLRRVWMLHPIIKWGGEVRAGALGPQS